MTRLQRIACTGTYAKDVADVSLVWTANLPDWADSPEAFWRSVDLHERANGVVYREVEISLPCELDETAQRELARTFSEHLTQTLRLPHTVAVRRGSGHNPRAHVMMQERGLDGIERDEKTWFKQANRKSPEKGGASKARELRELSWLFKTRELWANMANAALERAGHDARIDHRSYKDQGVEKTPQIHLGSAVHAMKARGIQTDRGELHDEIEEVRAQEDRLDALRARVEELEQMSFDLG